MVEQAKDDFFDIGGSPGYLKAGVLGFQGAGKSLTAALIAVIVRTHFKLDGPVAIFDTESGSGYLAKYIETATGMPPLIKRSRSFEDLMAFTRKILERGASVAIVDSVTHPWRELCDSYLKQVNESRERWAKDGKRRFYPKKSLEFQDWGPVKGKWAQFSDLYLNSPLHFVINGRAGYEYDMQKRDEDDPDAKVELTKTGVKMKTENEFGYEPSLLIQMAVDHTMQREGKGKGARNVMTQVRRALVLKDRFMVLDGKEVEFPSTDDFNKAIAPVEKFILPHIKLLTAGAHVPVDTSLKTDFGVGLEGDSDWQREKRNRQIVAEEIEGVLVQAYPSTSAKEKQAKGNLLKLAFDTYSWTAIQNLPSEVLRKGLQVIVGEIKKTGGDPGTVEAPADDKKKGKVDKAAAEDLDAALSCTHDKAPAPSTLKPGERVKCPTCGETLEGEREELTLTAPTPARRSR